MFFSDPIMQVLYERHAGVLTPIQPKKPDEYFSEIASTIIGQQLSVKVADVIWKKLHAFCDGDVTAQKLLSCTLENFRMLGISGAKSRALHDLSARVQNGSLDILALENAPNEHVVHTLCMVKGIGPWTAEMFLIFGLGRPDVCSGQDYGIRKAIQNEYLLPALPTVQEVDARAIVWSPYKSTASRLLWKSLEKI